RPPQVRLGPRQPRRFLSPPQRKREGLPACRGSRRAKSHLGARLFPDRQGAGASWQTGFQLAVAGARRRARSAIRQRALPARPDLPQIGPPSRRYARARTLYRGVQIPAATIAASPGAWANHESRLRLHHAQNLVRLYILDCLLQTARPDDLDELCAPVGAKSEVRPPVVRGEIASRGAHHDVLLQAVIRDPPQLGPNPVAIAP